MEPDVRRIDLARATAFALGQLEVRPSTLVVVWGGKSQALEPRVMQVLVALGREAGQVVSRDDLILSCWDGRIVGDDAISRCVAQLRAIARQTGSFEIDTIPRVGYRLAPSLQPAAAQHPAPTGVLLAVLPFDDLSPDAGMAYFSDGISEEILHTVAKRTDLRVIGRSSSFSFRGPAKAAHNVAQELKATHVLDGSVRRSGERVRITAELVECSSQTTMWSDRFDRDLTDVLRLQDEIAAAVAGALKAHLTTSAPEGAIDPEAYDLFLRARGVPLSQGIGFLEKTVSLEPQFAAAWSQLAHVRAIAHRRISLDLDCPPTSRPAVLAAAERALQLDPTCGPAYVALAQLRPWGDYSGREEAFRRALSVGAPATEAAFEMAWFLAAVGRSDEALSYALQAGQLDPLHPAGGNAYVQTLAFAGRYDAAVQAYEEARRKWPDELAFIYGALYEAAMAGDWREYDRLAELSEGVEDVHGHLGRTLAAGAMIREPTAARCERVRARLRDQIASTGTVQLPTLVLAHRMGLVEEAFEAVEQASFEHVFREDGASPAGLLSPGIIFDRSVQNPMMMDRRFVQLCGKLGLCGYWSRTARPPDCADIVPYDFRAEAARWSEAA